MSLSVCRFIETRRRIVPNMVLFVRWRRAMDVVPNSIKLSRTSLYVTCVWHWRYIHAMKWCYLKDETTPTHLTRQHWARADIASFAPNLYGFLTSGSLFFSLFLYTLTMISFAPSIYIYTSVRAQSIARLRNRNYLEAYTWLLFQIRYFWGVQPILGCYSTISDPLLEIRIKHFRG